jgi:hypothetical protein
LSGAVPQLAGAGGGHHARSPTERPARTVTEIWAVLPPLLAEAPSPSQRYSPCRVLAGGCAAGVLAGDDQITWATAMSTATDLACVVADGYNVAAGIAPKQ